MPQACVSKELISETNKENQVCEERGFAPLCLEFGLPAEWVPHRQRLWAPSVTVTFPARQPWFQLRQKVRARPARFASRPLLPKPLEPPRPHTTGAPCSPTSALPDARHGGAVGTEGAGEPNKCHTGRLSSLRESGQDAHR